MMELEEGGGRRDDGSIRDDDEASISSKVAS